MIKRFLPNEHVPSIFDIDANVLLEKGIKGIITDLDNTLVEWDRPEATPELIKWFAMLKEKGLHVTIVSNNNEHRVRSFSYPLNIPFIYRARKPMTKAFKRAAKNMELQHNQVVVIGDQIFTDVLGGNRLGLYTILVVPVAKSDGMATKLNRYMERHLLEWMKRKGLINWEE
ncbi:YqeG family HAD IIIA-type phosphatase [Pseudalkalibacillus decolorationis]|uniref:YqeG family HAD IIIA-type phosphatase n=1 Tax=Pseudalkalibacillus decolorationis TaxID=163879 RepID=UPI002147CFA9|nr:YqeG family HAD IIIA-type phosphatase [Pseudalkalibacillus decolorationis]